jgi:VWFA-related protein
MAPLLVSGIPMTGYSTQVGGQISGSPQVAADRTQAQERPRFRVDTRNVQVDVDVMAARHPVRGLSATDFELKDDGKTQPVLTLTRDSTPLDIVLLLDVSGSVRRYLPDMAAISRAALRKLLPDDRVSVIVFSRDSLIEQEFTHDPTEIEHAIEKASTEEPPGSGTRIYAAVVQAARYLAFEKRVQLRRRAILIVTDNSGMSYSVHRDMALRYLYEADCTLDALVIGKHPHPPVPSMGSVINSDFAFDDVFLLATQTGGEAITAKKPKKSFGDILNRIRDRYLLVYRVPDAAQPGTFRKIEVDLAPAAKRKYPRVSVSARTGYYVAKQPVSR